MIKLDNGKIVFSGDPDVVSLDIDMILEGIKDYLVSLNDEIEAKCRVIETGGDFFIPSKANVSALLALTKLHKILEALLGIKALDKDLLRRTSLLDRVKGLHSHIEMLQRTLCASISRTCAASDTTFVRQRQIEASLFAIAEYISTGEEAQLMRAIAIFEILEQMGYSKEDGKKENIAFVG